MAVANRKRLRIGCTLLAASMLPLALQMRYGELQLAEVPFLAVTLGTWAIACWGLLGGRAAWVVTIIRTALQVLAMGALLALVTGHSRRVEFARLQAMLSLAFALPAGWLLLSRTVRDAVWRPAEKDDAANPLSPPRAPSRLGTRGVLAGMAVVAVLVGAIEQSWIYGHLSLIELVLRTLYIGLPWAGAWLLARAGRDRILLTTLGALLGDMAGELGSMLVSGADFESVLTRLALPVTNVPAVLIGLALGIFGPRRPLWQLGLALPLAQVLYRAATVAMTSRGGELPWQMAVVMVLAGMGCTAAVYRFRAPGLPSAAGSVEQAVKN